MFENYENGQLKFKRNFKDGKIDGLYEWYYENGQLMLKKTLKTENEMVYLNLII